MTKESIYELQLLDCNCNNCIHMIRDLKKFEDSLSLHHKWQLDYFNTVKSKKLERAKFWKDKGENDKAKLLEDEALSMRFQFDRNTCRINYGQCQKFNKPVSFIPDTLQLDTQDCFEHRKPISKNTNHDHLQRSTDNIS